MDKRFEEPKLEVVQIDDVYAKGNNGGGNGNGNGGKGKGNNGKAKGHTSAYGKGNNDKWK